MPRLHGLTIVAALMAGCGGTTGSAAVASPTEAASPTSSPTPEASATARPTPANRVTPRPSPTPVARDDLRLVETGYTYFPGDTEYVHFAAVFENPNSATWVAERTNVNITWYKADGTVAGSTSEFLSLGLPGQRVAVAGVAFDVADPAEMQVQWRADWTEIEFAPGQFTFEGVNTSPDDFGGVTTTGNIRSSFEQEQEFVRIVAVYKDASGNVLGGDATYADFVPAGGTVSFEVSPLGDLTGVAQTDLYASP